MMLFAQVFRSGGVERDLLQAVGMAIAAVLLSMFAYWHVRSDAAKRPRLVATLALVAVLTTVWAAVEAAVRLYAALANS